MYGLLLQSALEFIASKFSSSLSQEVWNEAVSGGMTLDHSTRSAGRAGFSLHQIYSDRLIGKMAEKTSEVCGESVEDIVEQFGRFFVRYTHQQGYENLLTVLGRNLSDFVIGLDNLHEYFRSTYPKMKAPSFSVVHEDADGITISYRSSRPGLHGYCSGQLVEVARLYYGIAIAVTCQKQKLHNRGKYSTQMRLDFDNVSFITRQQQQSQMAMELWDLSNVSSTSKLGQSMTSSFDSVVTKKQKARPDTIFDKITFYVVLNHDLEIEIGRASCRERV